MNKINYMLIGTYTFRNKTENNEDNQRKRYVIGAIQPHQ